MSFLSRLTGGSKQPKSSRAGWEPPKIPKDEHIEKHEITANQDSNQTTDNISDQANGKHDSIKKAELVEPISSFGFISNEANDDISTVKTSSESSFSFLNREESNPTTAVSSAVSDAERSQFSFISDEKESHVKKEHSPSHDVKKKVAPRKKKFKAIQPGYGRVPGPSKNDVVTRLRSSSNTSTSETRSEGSVDSEVKNFDDDDKSEAASKEDSLKDYDGDNREESISSYESGSLFDFISDNHESGKSSKNENPLVRDVSKKNGDSFDKNEHLSVKNIDAKDDSDVNVKDNHEKYSLETPDTQNETNKIHDDTTEELSDLKYPKETVITAEESSHIDMNSGGEETSETPENKNDIEIRNETLQDLEGILEISGHDVSMASYDLHLDEEEKFEVYLETLKSREASLKNELNSLRENRDEILSNLKETTFSKDYLSSQLKDLQSEQNIAVSKEDFALADKLNQQIELKQLELSNLKYLHPILDKTVCQFVDDCNNVLGKSLQECTDLEEEFQGIIEREKKNLESKITRNDSDIYKANLKLDEERTKLDREMSHITLDKEHLQKSKAKLENDMSERTRDQQMEKSRLLEEKVIVKSEIEELEAKLAALREKERSINSQIEDVDSKIQEMTIDFHPQEESLAREQREITVQEEEVVLKLKALEKTEAMLKERREKEEHLEQKCKENIQMLTAKIESLKTLRKEMDSNSINFQEIIDTSLFHFLPREEHGRLRERERLLSDELSNAEYQYVDYNTQITRLQKRLDDIEARVEELEKEKQIAISGRNFKAAKAVAEEKKQVIEEQLTSEEELKNLEEKKKELNLSINSVTDEISKIKEQILKNETELDKQIMSALTEAMTSLRGSRRKSSLESWIRPFILFEIQICKGIAKDIHSKYGWELPDVLSYDDDDDESDDAYETEPATIKNSRSERAAEETSEISDEIEEDISKLELQLQAAIESEDFDKADELNSKIEEHKSKLGSNS